MKSSDLDTALVTVMVATASNSTVYFFLRISLAASLSPRLSMRSLGKRNVFSKENLRGSLLNAERNEHLVDTAVYYASQQGETTYIRTSERCEGYMIAL